ATIKISRCFDFNRGAPSQLKRNGAVLCSASAHERPASHRPRCTRGENHRQRSSLQVCEGCDSIVSERVATCPNCYGYRFDEESENVIAQARLLGAREQRSVTAQDLL